MGMVAMLTNSWLVWESVALTIGNTGQCKVPTSNVAAGTIRCGLLDSRLCNGDTLCNDISDALVAIGWFVPVLTSGLTFLAVLVLFVLVSELILWVWFSSSMIEYAFVNVGCSGWSFALFACTGFVAATCLFIRHVCIPTVVSIEQASLLPVHAPPVVINTPRAVPKRTNRSFTIK